MRYLAAIAALLYSASVTPEQMNAQWWWPSEFGYCTKTDIRELGGCGKLEVRTKPNWNLK
jgi:hypothetical protein